jgi:hypothetical protein
MSEVARLGLGVGSRQPAFPSELQGELAFGRHSLSRWMYLAV